MGFNVPLLNRDSEWCKQWLERHTKEPGVQKKLVLVIVSVALLLDNMLYMVIVPIIPKYLRDIHAYDVNFIGYHNETVKLSNGSTVVKAVGGTIDYVDEDVELGWLFASKALLQIFINPFSGWLIDRIGYELPMIIGLCVMFTSTAVFALGRSYSVLFFARSLQGLGSAFADTSGLAMIADRFTEEAERSAALGIALAFISFGCLVAPPFGSVLYTAAGKPVPFLLLALVCLLDAFAVFIVIQPRRNTETAPNGEKLHGTPMWRLFADPPIAVCSGALIMANVSLAFLEPTITTWMSEVMPDTHPAMVGMIWLPAFLPHVIGVWVTVRLIAKYPGRGWIFAAVGLAMEGAACAIVPFMRSAWALVAPLSLVCFGIALVDTSLLPMLGFLVDTRHVSVYGSVYAIADISYSLAYAFGPIVAGWIVATMGFLALNIIICVTNLGYVPVIRKLESVATGPYDTVQGKTNGLEDGEGGPNDYGRIGGTDSQPPHTVINPSAGGGYQQSTATVLDGPLPNNHHQQQHHHPQHFDPLNPQW